ncbi:MAG: hypothetical protein FWH17_01060 [Oscillospiraceae bacterium]|nr:hypothetical protein [Oscillospiraceae bacterium]
MNIAGVTQTAQVLPQTQTQMEPQVQSADIERVSAVDSVQLSSQVSMQVLDMAQTQFENAANELISSMAAATGVGSNYDISV